MQSLIRQSTSPEAAPQFSNQHLNSIAHAPVYECGGCDRSFGSQHALDQHLDSPAHAPLYNCDVCERWFGSPRALQQHYDSPAHAPVYECEECDRSFASQQSIDQHLNSPAHIFECDECGRSFGSQQSPSPIAQRMSEGGMRVVRGVGTLVNRHGGTNRVLFSDCIVSMTVLCA